MGVRGGVEPSIVAGPFNGEEVPDLAVQCAIKDDPCEFGSGEIGNLFTLTIKGGLPELSSFSSGYMDKQREIVGE